MDDFFGWSGPKAPPRGGVLRPGRWPGFRGRGPFGSAPNGENFSGLIFLFPGTPDVRGVSMQDVIVGVSPKGRKGGFFPFAIRHHRSQAVGGVPPATPLTGPSKMATRLFVGEVKPSAPPPLGFPKKGGPRFSPPQGKNPTFGSPRGEMGGPGSFRFFFRGGGPPFFTKNSLPRPRGGERSATSGFPPFS